MLAANSHASVWRRPINVLLVKVKVMLFDLSVVAPNDALYKELWHACAGPLVTVPREGERVYYFPQGHMEQVPFTTVFLFYF